VSDRTGSGRTGPAGRSKTKPTTGKTGAAKAAPPVRTTERLAVRKTHKLFIGGAFPRSESGRSYPVHAADGTVLAFAAKASRKDMRDAVVAARGAFAGWSGAAASKIMRLRRASACGVDAA
jgi:hypothetical protein